MTTKKKKTAWVMVEWIGPDYSVPVQGGRALFDAEGRWDYGLHTKGDKFAVLRVDAEADPKRFLILGGVAEPEQTDMEEQDEALDRGVNNEHVVVRNADDSQPPAGEKLQAEANASIPDVKAKLEDDKSSAKKK